MATITWLGGAGGGDWSNPLRWSPHRIPTTLDLVTIAGTGDGTVRLGAPSTAIGVTLATGTDATLLIASDLTMPGTLIVNGGTLDLATGGRIIGGTVDEPGITGGTIIASGGTADGVVWLAAFGNGLVITSATATNTELATGKSINVQGTLTLESGTYTADMMVDSFGKPGSTALLADAGAAVTLNATVLLSAVDPHAAIGEQPGTSGVLVGGLGFIDNLGTLAVQLPGGLAGGLTIAGLGMRNDGLIQLDPVVVPDVTQTFTVPGHGKTLPTLVTLTWNETLADHVAITATEFFNNVLIEGAGAVITVGGGPTPTTFVNSGTIELTGTTTQQANLRTGTLDTIALPGSIEIAAGTNFANNGVITAGTIQFDGNVTLAELGTLNGLVVIAGTLDLGNGTLDATATPGTTYDLLGTVVGGTLIGAPGQLLGSPTLDHVIVAGSTADILHDIASGTVMLDDTVVELTYANPVTVAGPLTVIASGSNDVIAAMATGRLTLGADVTITDTIAGSNLSLAGPGITDLLGNIVLAGSNLVTGTLEGTGTIALSAGAALMIGAIDDATQVTVDFAGGGNVLILPLDTGSGTLGLVFEGLRPGDLLDFAGISSNPGNVFAQPGAAISGGQLFVQGASGDQATVALAGSTAGLTFTTGADGAGGTIVTVACFRHGTRIATAAGARAVERLRIGDLVETARGPRPILWLGRRDYPASLVARQLQLRPVRIPAGALGAGIPQRALDLSPLHAVLIDGVLVPVAALVGCAGIARAPIADTAYVHVELAEAGIVYAEGAAAETFVDCASRGMFDNAASFAALDIKARPVAWTFPAPRVESGWRLAALRNRLGSGIGGPGGDLRGAIDVCEADLVEGWAADGSGPVELEVTVGGRQVGCIVANRYRIDLDHAGLPHPASGFSARLPGLGAAALARITLSRLIDGAELRR